MRLSTKLAVGVLLAAVLAVVPLTSQSKSSPSSPKRIVLTAENTINLSDVIEGGSVSGVISKAKALDKSGLLSKARGQDKDPIYVFLRTPGGEIQTGLEMLEALKGLNRPVDTVTMFAASMGFQTVQGLGKRYIVENGVLMSHRAKGGFEGEFGGQKPSQIDSRKNFWEQRLQEMDEKTVERSNGKQTLESYQKQYASEMWVTGRQAVAQGYADEVVQIQCDESLAGTTTHSINFMGMNIAYELDNCPLNSTPQNAHVEKLLTNKGIMKMSEFMEKNGGFGSACLVASGTDTNKICAVDTSLSLEKVTEIKNAFTSYYMNIKDRSIPLDVNYAFDRVRM